MNNTKKMFITLFFIFWVLVGIACFLMASMVKDVQRKIIINTPMPIVNEKIDVEEEEIIELSEEEIREEAEILLASMERIMGGTAQVYLDHENRLFLLTPRGNTFKNEMMEVIKGDRDAEKSWKGLVDSFKLLSKSMIVEDYAIAVLNPEDLDFMILLVYKGKLLYSFVE